MTRHALYLMIAVAIVGVFTALIPDVALAAGNDVGSNLGGLLEQYAGEIYGGVVAIISLVFLLNRRYSELMVFLLAAVVVAWMVFSPDEIASAARAIGQKILGSLMADGFGSIRSYQRIFRPDRRIFQIDNHRLPVPGGVPLGWLGYAVVTLLAVILLSTRGEGLLILAGLAAAGTGWMAGGSVGAILAAATAIVAVFVAGAVLSVLDWPLRLLVLPAMVATLLTQATPDGRPARRYVISWVGLQLRPPRRSAGRPLPAAGLVLVFGAQLWIAADQRSPWLRRARVTGAALIEFTQPLPVCSSRWLRRASVVRSSACAGRWRRAVVIDGVSLDERERLEIRP